MKFTWSFYDGRGEISGSTGNDSSNESKHMTESDMIGSDKISWKKFQDINLIITRSEDWSE